MNTTTTKLMAALIAIAALAPAPALAAESTNPYTVKLSNDVCTFGIDLNNPEARAYSQDRGYVNQSYVLDKIAKETHSRRRLRSNIGCIAARPGLSRVLIVLST